MIPLFIFLQYVILIWQIPLNLNWSKNLYGGLLRKSFILFLVTTVVFAVIYYIYGIIDTATGDKIHSFYNSLYFSFTTWTTLGYGDFKPIPSLRLLTSIEAVLGILSIPLIFTMIWKYCEFRLKDITIDSEQDILHPRMACTELGIWREIDNNGDFTELKQKYALVACKKCNNTKLKVVKYYLILGFISPRINFMVHCSCGNNIYGKYTAMGAARKWNNKNK